jgi:hypothetical protein
MTQTAARIGALAVVTALTAACGSRPSDCGPPPSVAASGTASAAQLVSLTSRLGDGRLRSVNRAVTPLTDGDGVRVTAAPGVGVIWIPGLDFADGTIDVDVCGRDVDQASFLGIAFHRRNDETYEAVYLRPFNFRSGSPERRQHAVQYNAVPDSNFARLRATFPGEFEKAVDPSVPPTAWNRLRVVVRNGRVQAFVGKGDAPALDVRELQSVPHGEVGLYVDNGSDGVFANLRIVTTSER